MIELAPNETKLLVLRRHWWALVGPALVTGFFAVVPFLAVLWRPPMVPALADPALAALIYFLLGLYYMALASAAMILWINFSLDAWIITDRRIIDVQQFGLFHREISEIPLSRVQNVTVEIPGLIPTMLGFGNIKIETAGTEDFTIATVARHDEARDLILRATRAGGAPTGRAPAPAAR